ncbi:MULTISPECIES: PPK2 family polyphosphate kinase [Frigoribacterium]|jgi:PPK2 family polyphosphate:nucleotide phosphotransferase|uniref:PPK2 family polyphosphate kinase n=1 Tax=Frigoribacterium TaxID=96492 RepID=UPI000700F910|nr:MULTISPECIES: PPK2 family polyphosphate kinase [Frigoribacterium]KQM25698.1 phosphate--nucleotide phosphotransferase [Frigoribacterium sp. Leaf8]MBD8139838.1 polyphosphate kinase 2 family protein [Frigoribacterium sp. CFBP 13605]MBD8486522.1 polyphosphate kinase 2 family protein [Frigoribacterium sp. CFBP 8759]NQW86663.1 polyphosphate kinase 2 family protein [Frigoribacterium sp. VKM Ac-2860]NQX07994.1 polyphosphate kinase 2 family protein [Frigoribacterium sp. VKM Ac-2859]
MAKTWTTPPSQSLRAGEGFVLADVDTSSTPGFAGDKAYAQQALESGRETLSELQEKMFAQSRSGGSTGNVLLVLQAMDTAGKGGIVRHVVGAVDPQGVAHHAFKSPTPDELAHDFLWRVRRELPGPGMIGVFDRSHYEDVLIGKVRRLAPPEDIEQRYADIVEFEDELVANGTTLVKVMLHISSDEQKERLADRLDRPDKHWKYNPGDLEERLVWNDYQDAYETAIRRTSTGTAPWFVVPADRKWYARVAVQKLLIDALASRGLDWPVAQFDVELEKTKLATS